MRTEKLLLIKTDIIQKLVDRVFKEELSSQTVYYRDISIRNTMITTTLVLNWPNDRPKDIIEIKLSESTDFEQLSGKLLKCKVYDDKLTLILEFNHYSSATFIRVVDLVEKYLGSNWPESMTIPRICIKDSIIPKVYESLEVMDGVHYPIYLEFDLENSTFSVICENMDSENLKEFVQIPGTNVYTNLINLFKR